MHCVATDYQLSIVNYPLSILYNIPVDYKIVRIVSPLAELVEAEVPYDFRDLPFDTSTGSVSEAQGAD